MKAIARLAPARDAGTLRDADVFLARHLLALTGEHEPALALAIAALSARQAEGHTCLDLGACAGGRILASQDTDGEGQSAPRFGGLQAPDLALWREVLGGSRLVWQSDTPPPASPRPLVLDAKHRLYFQRYFQFERQIAAQLAAMAKPAAFHHATAPDIAAALAQCFPPEGSDQHQRAAAHLALMQPLAVITGGPGTGKTTTVARVLAGMLTLAGNSALRIRLAAPTGKAATRLGEAIGKALAALAAAGLPAATLAAIPTESATLHRLLGIRPNAARPLHHAGHPLDVDVLVVDEASMLDLTMMARLLDALPPTARLILLGDGDQLASVEAGAVLGDVCASAALAGCVARLAYSHRFAANGAIGQLAVAINAGDLAGTEAALGTPGASPLGTNAADTDSQWVERVEGDLSALCAEARLRWQPLQAASSPAEALAALDRFRVLCAVRQGRHGVLAVNQLLERTLAGKSGKAPEERYFRGRPLLVTSNDYGVQLFNGDVGVVWPDERGQPRAWFQQGSAVRSIALNRLPPHETAYAMTVHKSQGSEFEEIALVLPDYDSPVVTRELLYTAVTRATRRVRIHASWDNLARGLGRPVARASGLQDALADPQATF